MRDAAVSRFLVAATAVSVLWGLSLWYFAERSHMLRRWVFFAMTFTRRRPGEVRSVLLGAVYYGLGLLASILFACAFRLSVPALASFSAAHLGLVALGIVAEISLTKLFVDLGCQFMSPGRPERFVEVREIPWIQGLRELPAPAVPMFAALGGVVEELFFRGVLLRILTEKLLVAPPVAVTIAGALFFLEQAVQVRTAFQAMVIGSSCVAISLGGGLLVLLTGSAVPAIFCHACFVIFFMARETEHPRS